MAQVTYSDAPEVREIADKLIPKHHPHLEGSRIDYVFRSKHSTNKGKIVGGKARKVTGLNAFLASSGRRGFHGTDLFVIEIAHDLWEQLPQEQRVALVDHELCHCFREVDDETGEWVLSILPHDLEEFAEVVKRHGIWSTDLDYFVKKSQQLRLIS